MTDTPADSSPRADYLYSLALQACICCWPLFEMQRMRSATSARKAPGQGFGQLTTHKAAYLRCETNAAGERLSGARQYVLRFPPGRLPPVDAFWSITMYSSADCLLVANPIERYAIVDRTSGLVPDADGGLTIRLLQAPPLDAPGRANWLPAPADDFFLCLRAYLPKTPLLDGSYRLPDPQLVG